MKKLVHRLSKQELANYPITDIIDGWYFRILELSQGYYRVEGKDAFGRSVSRDGVSPDELINECKEDIQEMLGDNARFFL
jgi:hypothetical protein